MAFVLIPFEAPFDAVFDGLIQPALDEAGFEVRRADSLLNQQNILRDIVRGITDAALVVADVTGVNENVLYELGLAHALGKRTMMITQDISGLPFDLRAYRATEYSIVFNEAEHLKEVLGAVGRAVLDGSAEFSNPVQDFAPEALTQSAQVRGSLAVVEQATGSDGANPSEGGDGRPPEPEREGDSTEGLLDHFLALETSSEELTQISTAIGGATEAIGDKITEHGEKLTSAQAQLGTKGAGVYLKLLREAAKDVDEFADTIAPLNEQMQRTMQEFAAHTDALAREAIIEDEAGALSAEENAAALEELQTSMTTALEEINGFAQTLLDTPNISKDFTRASRRAGRIVSETATLIETARAELARSAELIRQRVSAFRGHSGATALS
ncbi:MAG: hypothetical protein ACJ735_11950 [Actinomycetes bacterium]